VNYGLNAPRAAALIDLAQEPDFALGPIEVRPSIRQVAAGGHEEFVQPRVMQVLVALGRANGAVVSRDELTERCWGGRIVGEDSINRCIGKIRDIAALGGAPDFEVETIPRVGYRLKLLATAEIDSSADRPVAACAVAGASPVIPGLPQHTLPWIWIGIGLAMAASATAIAATLWLIRLETPAKWTVVRSEVLVANSMIARHPAISPDGSMIAYSAGKDEVTRKIYLQRISGGDPLQLTDDSYDDTSPAWSPDGAQIAYATYKEGEPCRLMVTTVPAGPPRELARCRTDERSHVSWSVSGAELFFLDRPDTKSSDRIMRYDLTSGRRTALTHPPAGSLGEGEPALSPDGRWITFERHLSDLVDRQIVLDLRTGIERVLIPEPHGDSAAWSEDSRTVFVETKHDRDFALWAWPIDGGAPSRILSSPDDLGRLSSGPHGLLAVEIVQSYDGLARPPRTMGGGPNFLAPERGSDVSPDIARDGTIAMTADRPGGAGLWLMPKGGTFRKLIGINAQAVAYSEARWSPDGSRIAFTAPMGNAFGIRIITAAGSDVATIRFRGSSLNTPAWSADGRALIFPGRDAQGWRLWRVDLAHTGAMTPISGTGWQYVRTRNNEIYGVRDDGPGVWRIDGVPRRITPRPGPDASSLWTIAGDEIAYVDRPSGEQSQILAQPIDGGPARLMARVPGYCWCAGFAVDPVSGAVIYPAALGQESDIELLHLVRN
jgi:Tol biopolymer transport system component/DNA-binding winged helix-turn-helix (wHTH) protein